MRSVLIPIEDLVVLPGTVTELEVSSPLVAAAAARALEGDRHVILAVAARHPVEDFPVEGNLLPVATLARIIRKLGEGPGSRIMVEGLSRVRLTKLGSEEGVFLADVQEGIEPPFAPEEDDAIFFDSLHESFEKALSAMMGSSAWRKEAIDEVAAEHDGGRMADLMAYNLNFNFEEQRSLLQITDPRVRLERLFQLLDADLQAQSIRRGIKSRLTKRLNLQEKKFVLREELDVVRKELEKVEKKSLIVEPELREIEDRIRAGSLPPLVRETAEKELARLQKTQPSSPEAAMIRDYLEWILDTPWSRRDESEIDLKRAAEVLDENHAGLEKVKERILEHLAVMKLSKRPRGEILCFYGPPGVGKTSLGRSIAEALGRKFVHFSLGGMRDEAEIRGHRRTYLGALPGRIVQRLKRVGVKNPVFVLDEVDKIGADFKGDPAAALLEVLDPTQNREFNDHYLDLPLDLSECFFILTANDLGGIPHALRDRLEIIEFSGYTLPEKLDIARRFLVPKAVESSGLEGIAFEDDALKLIIEKYTREAGLRDVDRQVRKICRKLAWERVGGAAPKESGKAGKISEKVKIH